MGGEIDSGHGDIGPLAYSMLVPEPEPKPHLFAANGGWHVAASGRESVRAAAARRRPHFCAWFTSFAVAARVAQRGLDGRF